MMNRKRFFALSCLVVLACTRAESAEPQQESRDAYVKRLEQENEILRRQAQEAQADAKLKEEYIDTVTTLLNKFQDEVKGIAEERDELSLKYSELFNNKSQAAATQSDDLLRQVQALRDRLEVASIELANARLAADNSKARNAELVRFVETLQRDLRAKTEEAASLRLTVNNLHEELLARDKRNEQLLAEKRVLEGIVEKTYEELNAADELIARQRRDEDRVWYRSDTFEALQRDDVIDRRGLFGWSLATTNFGKQTLQPFSRYALREITYRVPPRRLKVITTHDRHSFQIVPLPDGGSMLRIRNRDAFWATSRYLVVAINVN